MDGSELARRISADPALAGMRLVMLTSAAAVGRTGYRRRPRRRLRHQAGPPVAALGGPEPRRSGDGHGAVVDIPDGPAGGQPRSHPRGRGQRQQSVGGGRHTPPARLPGRRGVGRGRGPRCAGADRVRRHPDGLPDARDGRLHGHGRGPAPGGPRPAHARDRHDRRRQRFRPRSLPGRRDGRLPLEAGQAQGHRRRPRPLGRDRAGARARADRRRPGPRSGPETSRCSITTSSTSCASSPPTARSSPRSSATFLRTAPDHVSELRAAVADGDTGRVRQSAHRLRGESSALGAVELAGLCATLEEMALAGRLDGAPATTAAVDVAFGRAAAALRATIGPRSVVR